MMPQSRELPASARTSSDRARHGPGRTRQGPDERFPASGASGHRPDQPSRPRRPSGSPPRGVVSASSFWLGGVAPLRVSRRWSFCGSGPAPLQRSFQPHSGFAQNLHGCQRIRVESAGRSKIRQIEAKSLSCMKIRASVSACLEHNFEARRLHPRCCRPVLRVRGRLGRAKHRPKSFADHAYRGI